MSSTSKPQPRGPHNILSKARLLSSPLQSRRRLLSPSLSLGLSLSAPPPQPEVILPLSASRGSPSLPVSLLPTSTFLFLSHQCDLFSAYSLLFSNHSLLLSTWFLYRSSCIPHSYLIPGSPQEDCASLNFHANAFYSPLCANTNYTVCCSSVRVWISHPENALG